MTTGPRLWISVWIVVSSILVIWDAGYCLMRPRSFRGGDLHWIWKPYSLYQDIDLVYGVQAHADGNGFTNAQTIINIFEVLGNLIYLYRAQIMKSPDAPLIGILAATSSFSKTVLYWLQEYFCGYCAVGHNDFQTLLWLWIVPNGAWLVFPLAIMVTLGKDIGGALRFSAARGHNAARTGVKTNGKSQ